MKKIFCLIPSMVGGGAEKVMSIMVNELSKRDDYEISLLNMERLPDEFAIDEKVKRMYLSQLDAKSSAIKKALAFPFQLYSLITILRTKKPDYLIAFLERSVILALLSSHFISTKIIVSERNGVEQNLTNRGFLGALALKFVYRFLFNRAHKVIAVTEQIRRSLTHRFKIKSEIVTVINNPYELSKINILKQEPVPPAYNDFFSSGRVLINIGRYYPVKNQLHLIDLFSEIVPKYPDVKLGILGKGPLESDIQSKIRDLNLTDRVLLPGFQANPYSFLNASYLYVLTSHYEGFPNALVEAMICEKPVISYDCETGPREILGDCQYGILVPQGDKEKFKTAICQLLDNPKIYDKYRINGLTRAREFSVTTFLNKIESLL